jgi:hypothetical protein
MHTSLIDPAHDAGRGRLRVPVSREGVRSGLPSAHRLSLVAAVRARVLGIAPEEASFARRGFHAGEAPVRAHLEGIGRAFLQGYNAGLAHTRAELLGERLSEVSAGLRGFAFEGAAMALTLLDCLTPWNGRRFDRFLRGPAADHAYMTHVGAGWALARLHRRIDLALARFDPLLGWLAVDGYGFHQGYFHWRRFITRREPPSELSGYARRAFDQGLGRSLWFVACADARRIADITRRFDQTRRPDLWSGIGLACAYAGGAADPMVAELASAGSAYRAQLAQGAAFAAKARLRVGNLTQGTARACELLCGESAEEAAAVTDAALAGLSSTTAVPAYEIWRSRISSHFAAQLTPKL